MAYKNDDPAKQAFIKKLTEEMGYEKAEVKAQPADIIAEKDGVTWYYEIKLTDDAVRCFGAATQTEWRQALLTPETYRFVIAIRKPGQTFDFRIFTPAEFMEYSTVPPFKVYFNISLDESKPKKRSKNRTAIKLTPEIFNRIDQVFQEIKND